MYAFIFTSLGALAALGLRGWLVESGAVSASRSLHHSMLHRVLHAPIGKLIRLGELLSLNNPPTHPPTSPIQKQAGMRPPLWGACSINQPPTHPPTRPPLPYRMV